MRGIKRLWGHRTCEGNKTGSRKHRGGLWSRAHFTFLKRRRWRSNSLLALWLGPNMLLSLYLGHRRLTESHLLRASTGLGRYFTCVTPFPSQNNFMKQRDALWVSPLAKWHNQNLKLGWTDSIACVISTIPGNRESFSTDVCFLLRLTRSRLSEAADSS